MRLRYRPYQAVAIAALAALITACAAFAPLYDRAMRQALTDIVIAREPAAVVGLQVQAAPSETGMYGVGHNRARPPAPGTVVDQVPADVRAAYLPPIGGYAATAWPDPQRAEEPTGRVVWRDGQCDHVELVHGACPERAGEVAVSEADARIFGYRVGTPLRIPAIPLDRPRGGVPVVPMTVTAIYRQQPGDYWFGVVLTGRAGILSSDPTPHVQHDVWLTSPATFGPEVPPLTELMTTVDLPLDRDRVGVDDVLALAGSIDALQARARTDRSGIVTDYHSGLPDLAETVRDQTAQSRVTVPLLMAQLGLLAVVVLWLVLLAVTEQRRPEVALARLRGRGRRGARALLLGELLPVALAGVVPGALLAVLGAWVARTLVLPGSAPFELGLRFAAAVALAVVVLAVLAVAAVSRVAREPVETLLRRVPPRRTGWALGVADALVIAGAGGVVAVFATGGLEGPVALAAPGLLAIVVGLVLAHLTTPTAGLLGGRLLRAGRLRAGVSVLDAARSPATRRVVAVVTLASALAVFSADALLVGDRNRASAAEQEAGAPMVAEVVGTELSAVRAALDDVDPDGAAVTPVVRVLPPGSAEGGTLAVVPESFRRIALFGDQPRPSSLWGRLRAPDTEPIEVTGDHLELAVADSTITSTRVDGQSSPVSFGLDLVTPGGETLHTTFGELAGRIDHRRLGADVSCRDGCYVTAVWFGTLPGATIDGRATLSTLVGRSGTDRVPLGPASQWEAYDDPLVGRVQPSSTGDGGLDVTVSSRGSTLISMSQAWVPGRVPVLVSGPLPPGSSGDRFTLLGIDGEDLGGVRDGSLSRVPGSRPGTSVVNLDVVQRGSAVSPSAQVELWFADDDPALLATVTRALGEHGVAVRSSTTLADQRRSFDESTAAWSLQLATLVGGAALLIALLVLLVSAVSSWRFRTRDLAALRMSGVPGRLISSMAVAAQLPAVLVGILAGTVAGLVGAHLAMPIVPLFASAPEVSTLDLGTAWGGVAVAVGGAILVLAGGSILIGRTLARRSGVRRLRETL